MASVAIRALVLAAALMIGGCGQTADPGRTTQETTVRTDPEPVTKRFPAFGDFTTARWLSGRIGDGDLGPSDVWMQGLVTLAPDVAKQARAQYTWTPADPQPEVKPQLTGSVPATGTWLLSKKYGEAAIPAGYSGDIYLREGTDLVLFDVTSS